MLRRSCNNYTNAAYRRLAITAIILMPTILLFVLIGVRVDSSSIGESDRF